MTGRRPSGPPPYFKPGEVIAWRYGSPGEPHYALPVRVVADDVDGLVVWLAAGSPTLSSVRADGLSLRDPEALADQFTSRRVQGETTWTGTSTLRIAPTGCSWSVWVFFDGSGPAAGEFLGWYVNVEEPHVRDGRGVYSRDHLLDLWVEPDRSVERKDVDELERAVQQGVYSKDEARRILAVAGEVENLVEHWGSPFRDGWEMFAPDPAWSVPARPSPDWA